MLAAGPDHCRQLGGLELLRHWESVDTHLVRSTGASDSLVAADTLFDILQTEEPDLWTASTA